MKLGGLGLLIITDYYNLPSDMSEWSDEEKHFYRNSCKNYHELKIRLSRELPALYRDVTRKLDLIRMLDDDIELSVILAMSNKLSHDYKRFHITLLMQESGRLKPTVIGYYYNGIIDESGEYINNE